MAVIRPAWPAPRSVQALVTTRAFGDFSRADTRSRLAEALGAPPAWLRQVHGTTVVEAEAVRGMPSADASVARSSGVACVVLAADCMPVLLADEAGGVVGAAHAGWRGLSAGVIESTLAAMDASPQHVLAWLGPAIGPEAYEVGAEVRDAFVAKDPQAAAAFRPTRPGHWLLDLYAVARQRLVACGVARIHGGGFCTYTEKQRFFSFRRDRTSERMAAAIWLSPSANGAT